MLRTRWASAEACDILRKKLPELAIRRCEIDPLTQGMKLYDITATVPGQAGTRLTAESAEVRLGASPLFFGPPELALVHLAHPSIRVDLTQLKPRPKGPRACPLDALEKVTLDRLRAHDATVEVVLPGGRGVELSAVDAEWTLRRGVVELEVKVGSGVFKQGAGKSDLLIGPTQVQASLDPEAQQLQIASAEGMVDDVTWSVGGKVDTLCEPNLLLDAQAFLPLRTVAKVVPLPLPEKPQGHVLARVHVSGRPESPSLTADLTGAGVQIGKIDAPSFIAKLSLQGKELRVLDLAVPAGAGFAHVNGVVQLEGTFPIRATASLERADLARVLDVVGMKGAWVNLVGTGKALMNGTGKPLQLDGAADFDFADFTLTSHAYDAPREGRPVLEVKSGQARGGIHVLPDRVDLTNIEVAAGRSSVTGKGSLHYAQDGGLQLDGKADLDLGELGHLAKFEWRGTASAGWSVHGPYKDVRVEAQLAARDMVFWDYALGNVQGALAYQQKALRFTSVTGVKGKTPYSGSVDLDWSKEKNGAVRLSLQVPRGRAEDLVEMIVRLHPGVELFQGELFGDAEGTVELAGPFDRFGGTIDLGLDNLKYYGRGLGRGRVRLDFHDGEVMELTEARLAGPAGKISAEGSFSFGGPLSYHFRGTDLSLAELVGTKLAEQMGITGKLQLSGKVVGDRDVPVVDGYVSSGRVTFADKSLGVMNLNARIQGRELEVWGRPFDAATGRLKMTLKAPIPYQLHLAFALPEIRPLLPDTAISQGMSGTLSGTVDARGEVKTKDSAVVYATVDDLSLSRGDFAVATAAPVNVRFERGRLWTDGLVLQGPDTQLGLGGWVGPEDLGVKAEGSADVRLLASFVRGLERAGGEVEMSATATGPLSSPEVLGSARIRDVHLSVRDQPYQLRSLSGDLEFSEQQISISNMDGVLNDGRVELRGYVKMDRFLPRRGCGSNKCLSLELVMDEIAMRPLEDLPFTTSGKLTLEGDPDSLVLSGGLDVDHLHYERPMDLEAFLKDFARTRERLVESSQSDKRQEWLKFDDVRVRLADVRVENNLARARFQGEIKLTGSNARPGLVGMVEAAEGSQVFFRQNRFDVSELLIELKNRYAVDPVFDMHAQSQVREYLVRLHAFGKPNEPKIILTSEPMLAEADVISLLTLGVTSKDKSQSTGVETATYLAAEALYNASGLDREVQRFLPKNTQLVKDLSFHFSTSYNDVLHQMEPAAQIESRLLTEDLKLELTRPFSGRGTRARIEYRLLDGVLVQGQWDNENSTSGDLGNIGADLKLHWEVK
ncbi:MAG TPA: translocation/assembly module TamB domain-containing protein [Myxococcaceae bacterium]|nr:translocation/assembly module TamB domain-containing protein [Myxococcaceae bacterium]